MRGNPKCCPVCEHSTYLAICAFVLNGAARACTSCTPPGCTYKIHLVDIPTRNTLMIRKQKDEGFSLIELPIVVAIILIIAAGAIPNLLRARMAANEASAVGSMRTR